MELLFTSLHRLLDTAENSVKETVIITIGAVGKYVLKLPACILSLTTGRKSTKEVLGLAVCRLIAQLSDQNPVIKGTAYMQVSGTFIIQQSGPLIHSRSFGLSRSIMTSRLML
jgi:serine/threonine-protein kinase ATR